MEDFEKELKLEFLAEAAQSLTDTEQCFLSLENDPNDTNNLNKIFRLAHNLKGSSKAVGFDEMGAFTHEFETFILKIKNGELVASPHVVNVLLRCNDHLIKMVDGLKQDLASQFDSTQLLTEMNDIKEGRFEKEQATQTEEIITSEVVSEKIEPSDENIKNVETAVEIEPNLELLASLGIAEELEKVVAAEKSNKIISQEEPNTELINKLTTTPLTSSTAINKNTQPATVDESIRISLSKLENLLNYVGEMVILQSVMREQAMQTNSLLLKKTVGQLGKVSKEIQDISMSLRMVPVKPTFQKMVRIVRDTAQAVKKDVVLNLIGEETELDKTVLEKINDPLVHLIRNSVDHGIEPAQVRVANGKSAKGQVSLSAFHQSGKLVIEVKDDGGGLDTEKLKKKAIEKGIIKSGAQLSEKEAFNLIFAPGFSTKEQVTDVSGRGVGMDVVRTNIQELSGEIQIFSQLGKGTTFQIILPLTLAIVDGMVVTFANEKYVIPLTQVHETLRPTVQQLHSAVGLGNVLLLRGENLPLFRVGDFFAKQSKMQTTDMIAMVIRTGSNPFAILVDDIIGQFQVVIKQLGPELQGLKGISGSTILGDGKPALILEPQDLLKRNRTSLGPLITGSNITGGKAA